MAWLLRSVGLGGDGKDTFPYTVAEKVGEVGLWDLHNCARKADGEALSVLIFDRAKHHKYAALGLNVFNSMKRLRHPALVHYVDGKEAPDKLFIVTEQLRPLKQVLGSLRESHPGAVAWGIHEIARAIHFLNVDCSLVHGNLTIDAVVVNRACDWKLAGLELVSDTSKRDQPLEACHTLLSDVYKPPELSGPEPLWLALCKAPRAYDAWLLGCFVSQIFHEREHSGFRGEQQLKDLTPLPTALRDEYKDLLRPFQRRTMENFLGSRYFKDDYVQSMFFLETIALKDDYEKDAFFKRLAPLIEALPPDVSRYKVLPELVKGLDYGTANFRVLGPILDVGATMTDDEFRRLVGASVLKWFASPDRSLRRNLLEHLGAIVARFDATTVNDKIFPSLADGFEDKSPILREATVKAVLTLAPKLKTQTIETDVLRHFARLQLDPEPGIRTNTTICLGKISDYLSESTRHKILASAFVRALKDHFPPSRLAGVMSLNATSQHFSVQEIAKKIVPALSHMTIDTDPRVREEAFKAIKQFIGVLEKQYTSMSEDQFVKEATRDTTERTVLDWAQGLVNKATSHVAAVAANKVLGAPMPKEAPPQPKYSEDHVRAMSEQVRAESNRAAPTAAAAAPVAASPAGGGGFGKKQDQAADWGEAFDSTAREPAPSAKGALKITNNSNAAPVISDGWGDADEEWSDEAGGEDGWSSVYGATKPATTKPASAPATAKPAAVSSAPPPQLATTYKPAAAAAAAAASASTAASTAPASTASTKLPPLQQPPKTAPVVVSTPVNPFANVAPQQPVTQLLPSKPVQPSPQPTLAFGGPGIALAQPAAMQKPLATTTATTSTTAAADGWGSFSFGNTSTTAAFGASDGWGAAPSSSAGGGGGGDGWGDLSFLEGKGTTAPAPAASSSSSSKSSKKTKKSGK